jgi:Electron transfer DM13
MMKLKYLTVGAIATIATLTVACTRNEAAPQPTEVMPSPSVISTPISTPMISTPVDRSSAASPAIKSGQFVTAEHTTEGAARIVTENGKRYLVFDSAFMTDAGPDLLVLLHQEQMPQTYAQNYISLGELQNVKGEQRYAIADDVDLANFQSVVIWCRQFNATFGYAPFGAG